MMDEEIKYTDSKKRKYYLKKAKKWMIIATIILAGFCMLNYYAYIDAGTGFEYFLYFYGFIVSSLLLFIIIPIIYLWERNKRIKNKIGTKITDKGIFAGTKSKKYFYAFSDIEFIIIDAKSKFWIVKTKDSKSPIITKIFFPLYEGIWKKINLRDKYFSTRTFPVVEDIPKIIEILKDQILLSITGKKIGKILKKFN